MKLTGLLYDSALSTAQLAMSRHKSKIKRDIFLKYNWMCAKHLSVKNKPKESFLGYTIRAFDYETILAQFREIFVHNAYYFEANTKKPVILDCGGNIGMATLYFKWLYPSAEIYAFEANKDAYEMFSKNIKRNKLKDITIENCAVLNRDGKVTFYKDEEHAGSGHMSIIKERVKGRGISVPCISLASVIGNKHIDFLKMDIEGAEEIVLKDLDEKNKLKQIKEMVIEYHHHIGNKKANLSEFLAILEKNGFDYQIETTCVPFYSKQKFQDLLIYAYQR